MIMEIGRALVSGIERFRSACPCCSLLLLLVCCALLGADPSESATKSRPAPADLAAYTVAKSKVRHDSDAHVRLAVWCESHGLSAERMKHLAWPFSLTRPMRRRED